MEQRERRNTLSPFETFKQMEEKGLITYAALGYQALAMRANNRTLAAEYFDRSVSALEVEEESSLAHGPVPTHSDVYGRALLNLAPITKELVVNKRISEPDDVRVATNGFIHDLGKQARAAKQLILSNQPPESPLEKQRQELIAAFDVMAVVGTLLREQTEGMNTNQWTAIPAFLEPEWVTTGRRHTVIRNLWNVAIYGGPSNVDFELRHKIYVRYGRLSAHEQINDKDVSVVWVSEDLHLPGEGRNAVELDTIADLDSKTKRGKERLAERTWRMLQAVDNRSVGTLKILPSHSRYSRGPR